MRRPLEVVCCSLEPWDEVWRRNQFFVSAMLAERSDLRVLFVELPVDMTWNLLHGHAPRTAGMRAVGDTGRLWAVRPHKWLPRRLAPGGDRLLYRQVLHAASILGFDRPVVWVNDNTYAGLLAERNWPSVYDVTDDWVLADAAPREVDRQRRNDALMLERATEVVVCSPGLAASRGRRRSVHLIPNGVDVEHIRAPQPRPDDLPDGPVVLYQGSASEGRLDIDLCVEIATRLGRQATLVLLGPHSLAAPTVQRLVDAGTILLGARPYRDVPGYLQAARVLVVPHLVSPFTESLDPIKARELLALGRPTLATPVAGFRDVGPPVETVDRARFGDRLLALLADAPLPDGPGPMTTRPPSWSERAAAFLQVVQSAAAAP